MSQGSTRVRQIALARMAVVVCGALAIGVYGCSGSGGTLPSGSSNLPTPTPTPVPTPTPRTTINLDAPPDSGRYSSLVARLNVGASITIDFRPIAVNTTTGGQFGHAIEFWLFADRNGPIDLEQRGVLDSALSFLWRSGTRWTVSSVISGTGYELGSRNVDLPLGMPRSVRIRRTPGGVAQYFFDDELILELVNPEASGLVYVRTYGAAAEFSYVPGVFGASTHSRLDFLPPWASLPRPPL